VPSIEIAMRTHRDTDRHLLDQHDTTGYAQVLALDPRARPRTPVGVDHADAASRQQMINGGRRLLPVLSCSRVGGVAVVVNHLHLSDPLTEDTAQAFRECAPRILDAGATAAQVLPVDDTHLVLILEFASAQDVTVWPPRSADLGCEHCAAAGA
jgi:hypothetical protein